MAGKADPTCGAPSEEIPSEHFVHERLRSGRWVPPWLRYQSQGRYAWAAEQVAGRRVLEIGCGSGRGARQLLAAGAVSVDACDASQQAIQATRSGRDDPRLRFQAAAADRLPYGDEAFEVVVSLETIEHVADDARFVSEAARVLVPGGIFLCTTPNRRVTNPGAGLASRPYNPAHVREYAAAELEELLRQCFQEVTLWGQSPWSAAYVHWLGRCGRRWPRAAVRLHQVRKLLGMWADTPARHAPRAIAPGCEAEVLVALCTK